MTTRILVSMSLLALAACGGNAGTTQSPTPERAVRLLDANDFALHPVLYATAKHLFDPNTSQVFAFGGVYLNKRLEPSLTQDVNSYISRIGGFKQTSRPQGCDAAAPDPPARQRPPAATGAATGGDPNPRAQPKRAPNQASCNPGVDAVYTLNTFRIASDTAYVEVQIGGVAKSSTKCLSLTVNKTEGGWTPGEMKTSKIGRCGA